MDYTYDDLLETFLKRFLRVEGNTAADHDSTFLLRTTAVRSSICFVPWQK